MNMSLVLRLPWKIHLCRSSSNVPRVPLLLDMLQNPHVLLTFDTVRNPLRMPRETTSERQKVVRACCVFNVFTSKCASRHNGVHFFDISTSKSGPNLVCFVHFDFEMCFVPQRRALFPHRNFQKWSEHGALCTFWLRHVLRATTAYTFSTSQLPKVVRTWNVLAFSLANVFCTTTACTFSTSQLPSMVCFARFDLEMCFAPQRRAIFRPAGRFSEPSFRPSGASNQWKNTVFRDFSTFSRAWIFFLLTLSLLRSSLCCSSLLFFDSYHLCFSSVHTVGSLTSKLPSIIYD